MGKYNKHDIHRQPRPYRRSRVENLYSKEFLLYNIDGAKVMQELSQP